jgi:hypothetical protein
LPGFIDPSLKSQGLESPYYPLISISGPKIRAFLPLLQNFELLFKKKAASDTDKSPP